jgi:hypothetical protein
MFDTHHLAWPFVVVPAVLAASAINADNRYWGPYFAVADLVLNEYGTGYGWKYRPVLYALGRRVAYLIGIGVLLQLVGYGSINTASVFMIAGFLLIWPAFFRPLPVYAAKKDWQVMSVWALYVLGVLAAGMLGANGGKLIKIASGQAPSEFLRQTIVQSVFWIGVLFVANGFREPLQKSLWQKRPQKKGDPQ